MTAQSVAYLKSNEFTLGGAAGRIVPQYMVDMIDTMKNRTTLFIVKDPEYGAIGDGSSHPISGINLWNGTNTTGYSIAQWRTLTGLDGSTGIRPSILALTAEIDWVAHQVAIYTAAAAGGGAMISPAGHYRFIQTLVFPESDIIRGSSSVPSVNWFGDGQENTLMEWPTDLGAGVFAVTCVNRLNTTLGSNGVWQDLFFLGPNNSVALNASPASMHGLGWAEYRKMKRVGIQGFKGGLCLNDGGQTQLEEVETDNCFYGFYYDANNASGDNGDMTFIKCASNSSMKACIGIADGIEVASSFWIKCFLGTSPYGVFGEAATVQPQMVDCTFYHTQFEGFGNAVISDGLAAGAHKMQLNGAINFIMCQFSPNATYNIAALPKTGIICTATNFGHLNVEHITGAIVFTGITNGLFEIDGVGAVISLRTDLDSLLGNMSGVCPIGAGSGLNIAYVENTGVSYWRGHIHLANGASTISLGNILAYDTGGGFTLNRSAGNATEIIAGVCMLPNTASGGWVVIAQHGYLQSLGGGAGIVTNNSNVIAAGNAFRAATAGAAITSTGLAQTTSKNLGQWLFTSGSTPNLKGGVMLMGLE